MTNCVSFVVRNIHVILDALYFNPSLRNVKRQARLLDDLSSVLLYLNKYTSLVKNKGTIGKKGQQERESKLLNVEKIVALKLLEHCLRFFLQNLRKVLLIDR